MSAKQRARQRQEEHSRELLDRWKTIVTNCEKEIASKIKSVLEGNSIYQKSGYSDQRNDEIFRDKLWEQYRKRRAAKLCSRCGEYTSYSITESQRSLIHEIKDFNLYGGPIKPYKIEYKLESELITNPNGLADEPFYDLCKQCQDHVTGKRQHPLSFNLEAVTKQLDRLRKAEGNRRYLQEDDMKEIRAEILKKKKAQIEGDSDSENKDSPNVRHRIGNILQGGRE